MVTVVMASNVSVYFRLQVQNFWSSETRLPGPTLDRLVAMLEAMYSPVTEQQYLSYATNLLLEMTSKSPDYQREIFEHPLSECKFSVSHITEVTCADEVCVVKCSDVEEHYSSTIFRCGIFDTCAHFLSHLPFIINH